MAYTAYNTITDKPIVKGERLIHKRLQGPFYFESINVDTFTGDIWIKVNSTKGVEEYRPEFFVDFFVYSDEDPFPPQ